MNTNTYFHVTIRTGGNLFDTKSMRYAFLNIWRMYMQGIFQTCTYSLITDRFECIMASANSKEINEMQIKTKIVEILSKRCFAIFSKAEVSEIIDSVIVQSLNSEKEMIYKAFDMHTMPQRLGYTLDYRTYPFSSYKSLSTGSNSALAKQTVWNWFGGRLRFTAFHHAYAGWIKSPYYDMAS